MKIDISIEGLPLLVAQFKQIAQSVEAQEMENRLLEVGEDLRNKIQREVPKGETKNLFNSIVCKKFERKIKGNPAVFVAVDRKIAPHAHLVEYGTKGLRLAKKGVMKFFVAGLAIFARSVAPMPAQPFFRSTVDREESKTVSRIAQGAIEIIERASK